MYPDHTMSQMYVPIQDKMLEHLGINEEAPDIETVGFWLPEGSVIR